MLFDGFKLTPKGEQLLEIKDLTQVKVGQILLCEAKTGADLSSAAKAIASAGAGAGALTGLSSACFGGINCVAKSKQLNVRIHMDETALKEALAKPLRLIVLANEDVNVTEEAITGKIKQSAFDKQDGMVLGYVDTIESDVTTSNSSSATGIVFDAVVTVKGNAKSRCNVLDVMRCPYLMNGAVGNADLERHNLADESISERDKDKEAKDLAVAANKMEARTKVTPSEVTPSEVTP